MGKKIMKTMDGNTAAGYASYPFTEVAAIYPITPSSPMAEVVDEKQAQGETNMFGQRVKVVEMQSEAGASGAVHGSLASGELTTTYTASQGLLLMIPNMYKIAGELLPGVFHVTARTLATHALCIFGDHSDVMATRQTGFALLNSCSVQEVMDLGTVAHLSAIKGRVPFLHFFDGFRTSHEIQKIELIDPKDAVNLVDKKAIQAFKDNALNPDHPKIRGTAQNPDIFFQARMAGRKFYDRLPEIVDEYMKEISDLTGREYHLFDYVGAEDADRVIIAMGSVCECIEETINVLNQQSGNKLGLIKVRLYRPWAPEYLKKVMPKTVKKICVLDRTMEPGAVGDPLYMDVKTMYYDEETSPVIVAGRYGLGSKDTTPGQIAAVYENLKADNPKNHFTIGIEDDLYGTSLKPIDITTEPEGTVRCKFWGLGSDGTVGANKQAIKIIGDNTDLYAQGYFNYDSKKSGGVTMSHLRFGKNKIQSTYLLTEADYIACHNQAYVHQYDVIKGLKKGGTFLLNCTWSDDELDENLPASLKQYIAKNKIKFYTINGTKLGNEIGLGNRINMIMQSAFFKLSGVIPLEHALDLLKKSIEETYGRKGEKIVNMNKEAVDAGCNALHEVDVPKEWATAVDKDVKKPDVPDFVRDVVIPMNRQEGDNLPVSTFEGREDGEFPSGTAAYEKRGVAAFVPSWDKDKCIQCNQCSFVCPHSAVRPALLDDRELDAAPEGFEAVDAKGKELQGLHYRMQVSVLDCLGCSSCSNVCPVGALPMKPLEEELDQAANWDYAMTVSEKSDRVDKNTVKGSQFCMPYFEFSGACAGCGETPYIKVITQLYGDRMMIANATGCSSIWGASAPSMPYCKDKNGRGPSWANSLFEDNAEYGLGMATGVRQARNLVKSKVEALVDITDDDNVKSTADAWLKGFDDGEGTRDRADKFAAALKASEPEPSGKAATLTRDILKREDMLAKKSLWCLGGDGWSYDIGYGGLDHALASGEDINVLVFDTEVYSNTGGQSSKATPTGAVAQFAAAGKRTKKKDLGMMAMSYGYVYVAQVAIGADKNQFLKAVREAESYHGPSLIICYAPCINHGLKAGMGKSIENEGDAVKCGYWQIYRYNPVDKSFSLDCKEPDRSKFRDFMMGQVRYSSLVKSFPDVAKELFVKTEEEAMERYQKYAELASK